jgi:hypothetical protein
MMHCAVSDFHLEELQVVAHEWYRSIPEDRLREVIFKLRRKHMVKELRTKSKLSDGNSRNLTIFYLPKKAPPS